MVGCRTSLCLPSWSVLSRFVCQAAAAAGPYRLPWSPGVRDGAHPGLQRFVLRRSRRQRQERLGLRQRYALPGKRRARGCGDAPQDEQPRRLRQRRPASISPTTWSSITATARRRSTCTSMAIRSIQTCAAVQPVRQGQHLAIAGSTGWSTGPHLHFQVNTVHTNETASASAEKKGPAAPKTRRRGARSGRRAQVPLATGCASTSGRRERVRRPTRRAPAVAEYRRAQPTCASSPSTVRGQGRTGAAGEHLDRARHRRPQLVADAGQR